MFNKCVAIKMRNTDRVVYNILIVNKISGFY